MERITKSEFLAHLNGRTLGYLDFHLKERRVRIDELLAIAKENDIVIFYDDKWEFYFIYFISQNRLDAKVYIVYNGRRHPVGIGAGLICDKRYINLEYNFSSIKDNRHFFEGLNKAMNESYVLFQSHLD